MRYEGVILSAAKDPDAFTIDDEAWTFLARCLMPRGYVYILGNNTGTLYVGVTSRLGSRILEHKRGEGSEFTAKYGCHRLLYYERIAGR